MPETYVVHLGNSKELMEVAEDSVAKRVLREHVRESLGVRNEDLLFAIINSKHSSLMRSHARFLLFQLFLYRSRHLSVINEWCGLMLGYICLLCHFLFGKCLTIIACLLVLISIKKKRRGKINTKRMLLRFMLVIGICIAC